MGGVLEVRALAVGRTERVISGEQPLTTAMISYNYFSFAGITVAANVDGNGFKEVINHKEALGTVMLVNTSASSMELRAKPPFFIQ